MARAFKASGLDLPPDALERYLALYDERLLQHTRPYNGIPAMLERLASRAALAILTNKPIAATRRILDGLDLARFFPADAVLGGDGPFARKPDPEALRHLTAAAQSTPVTTVMVGIQTSIGAPREVRRRACVWRDTDSDSAAFRCTNWHPTTTSSTRRASC